MKKKLTLSIDPELNRRLDIQAAVDGKGHDRSSIVDALITAHISLPEEWNLFPDLETAALEPADDKACGRKREKTTFHISVKASRTLGLHAQLAETNRSRVVEALIEEHVPPWGVYDQRKFHTTAKRRDRRAEGVEINPAVEVEAA